MPEPESLPPDFFCPNPHRDCPGKGGDLEEIRDPIKDADGTEIGVLIFMACRVCGYRWDRESENS